MAVDYQTIIDNIDEAMLAYSGKPNEFIRETIETGDGRTLEYRSLAEMTKARHEYKKILISDGELVVRKSNHQPINITRSYDGSRKR
ncbi:MAG: hypothetical protein GY941_20695 [Planctomycetes bacterium]|nr:hypothetical protein [Planctomycetota bacterium]